MDLLLASEPSQPRSYAPQRDFESHKDTISHLYVDSNLTLRNVIKEMEQQHKFRATYISRSSYIHTADKLILAKMNTRKSLRNGV